MLSSYELVFQLSNVCFISWFTKIVGKDVYKSIKQNYAGWRRGQGVKKRERGWNRRKLKIQPSEFDGTPKKFSNRNEYLCKMRFKNKSSNPPRNRMQVSLCLEST